MMTILEDALRYPQLFSWIGPVRPEELEEWRLRVGFPIPVDLIDLWETTGGGDVFESETILSPGADVESPESRTTWLRSRGLPQGLLVVHEGTGITAIDESGAYVVFESRTGLRERARFGSLDEWYRKWLRAELAVRYGLTDAE